MISVCLIELRHNIKCSVIHGPIHMFNFTAFKKRKIVFSTFKVNLLRFTHVFTISNSLLIKMYLFSTGKSSRLKYKVVSSAYIKKLNHFI